VKVSTTAQLALIDQLRRPLWSALYVISVAGLVIEIWFHYRPGTLVEALLPHFSLSYETNLPTWWSSSVLLACAIVSGSIALHPTFGSRRSWWGVACAFAWASLDEAAELHENLGGLFGTGGILYFDWVISASVLLMALALLFWPWLRGLPGATRKHMIIAAFIYFGGALVLELPLGWWTERFGAGSLGYALIDWVEETMEMSGSLLMLLTLLSHRTRPASLELPTAGPELS
jgi:hypothetical protein